MSRELIEFSEQIDEQFNFTELQVTEEDDFWELLVNLFI